MYILKKRKGKQTIPKLNKLSAVHKVIIVYLYLQDNQVNFPQEVNVDMKRCVAYEITSLAKKKVVMETNQAYEQVRVNVEQVDNN